MSAEMEDAAGKTLHPEPEQQLDIITKRLKQ